MHRVLPAAVTSSGYKPEIDGLRAIAVLAVIAHHFWQGLLPGGVLGVDMFFVISGYVITASLSNHSHRSIQDLFLGFYARRVKRLLPALVVCVLTTALLGVVFINPEHPEFRSSLNAGAASLFGLSNIFFFREARDYFGASTALNLFTHTWSLGVEEQFYLFLPVLFWVSVRASQERRRTLLIVILSVLTVLSFAAYLWLSRVSHGAYFMMPFRFWELSIGCLGALLAPAQTNRHRCADPGFRYAPWVAFAAGALALLAPGEMRLFTTPLIVVSTATLIATLKPKHPIFRLLTLRIVLLIGLMSYSLYLWHWSVLSISRWTWGVNPLTAPLQIAAILALGALSYTLVERPLRRSVPRKIYDRINAMSVDPTQHNNQDMYLSNALTRVWFEENPRPEPDLSLPSSGRAIDDEIPF